MNDNDLNSLNIHDLASAFLDGEATAVERARVESTPELLAVVASMRQVAASIARLPAPKAAVREAAVTAALTAFDGLQHNANTDGITNVVSLATVRRWPRAVLATAAAVVVIGIAGISASRFGDDSNGTASDATQTKLADDRTDDAPIDAAPTAVGSEIFQSAVPISEINTPEQLSALQLPERTAVSSPVADTAASGGSGDEYQRLDSFNVDALACMTDNQVFLADIYYQGTLAIAVRDTVTGVTEAIDDTCTVLAHVAT